MLNFSQSLLTQFVRNVSSSAINTTISNSSITDARYLLSTSESTKEVSFIKRLIETKNINIEYLFCIFPPTKLNFLLSLLYNTISFHLIHILTNR